MNLEELPLLPFLSFMGLLLMSGFKYSVAAFIAITTYKNPLVGFFVTSIGGILSCYVWIFLGKSLQRKYKLIRDWYHLKRGRLAPRAKRFNRKNRIIVKIRRSYGLWMIALISPVLISLPVGCFISVGIESNPYRIWAFMSVSIILWGFALLGSFWVYQYHLGF